MFHSIQKNTLMVFLVGLVLFTIGLSSFEFTQFETRFAYFAQAISLNERLGFFPLLYGAPYPDYPITYPWLVHFVAGLVGKLNVFSAALPSAIQAAGSLALTYRLGAIHRPAWGVGAALCMLGTFYFLMTARSLSLDQFVLFASVWSFYASYQFARHQKKGECVWIYLACLYGFIFRGPMGVVLPMAASIAVALGWSDYRRVLLRVGLSILLLAVSTAGLLYLAYREAGMHFVWQVADMQGLSRLQKIGHYPFYYYWQTIWINYSLAAPLALCVMLVKWKVCCKKTEDADARFLRCLIFWFLIVILGLSLPSGKKLRYLLPIVPSLALLAAWMFLDNRSWFLAQCRSLCLKISWYFPYFLLLVLIVGKGILGKMGLHPALPYASVAFVWVGLLLSSRYLYPRMSSKTQRYLLQLSVGVMAFYVAYLGVAQPLHVYSNQTRPFAEAVKEANQHSLPLAFYQIGPDGEDVKLMLLLGSSAHPEFIQTPSALRSLQKGQLLILKPSVYEMWSKQDKMQFLLVYRGKIGHQPALIMRYTP